MWPIAGGRMSIGLVIGGLGCGAAARQLFELARALDPQRHGVRVYCLSDRAEPYGRLLEAAGIPVRILPRRGGWDPARLLALARALRRDAIDVVHAFPTGTLYGALAARLAGIATVIPCVRDGVRGGDAKTRRLLANVYRGARAVVADSRASAAGLVRDFAVSPERVRVVHDGVDLSRFPSPGRLEGLRDRVRGGPLLVGAIGPLLEGRNPGLLLRAAACLGERQPQAHVVELRHVQPDAGEADAVRGRGIPVVHVTGADDVAAELPRLALLWLTGDWHERADVVLEAMAAGRPVVAIRTPGVEELVLDGVTGLIVDAGDAPTLAERTRELLADAGRRRGLGQAARARVAGEFTMAAQARTIAALYESVLLGS